MRIFVLSIAAVTLLALASCETAPDGEPVGVSIDSSDVEMMPKRTRDFTATVTGTDDPRVMWSTTGGTISGSGTTIGYTAPSILGVYELTATSTADPAARAAATVRVVAYPGQAWSSQYSSDGNDVVTAMAIDSADNIVIAGYTTGALFPVPLGGYDAFVAKIAPDGTPTWAFQYGTTLTDFANALAIDSGDNVLLTGQTYGDLFAANAGSGDAFVVKMSPAGVPMWGIQHGTAGLDTARAVVVDSADNVIIGGSTDGDLFAPNLGGHDAFVAKMTSGGLPVGAFQSGSAGPEAIVALAVDSADNVIMAGSTGGDLYASNQGAYDGFVAKVSPTGVPLAAVQYGTTGGDMVEALAVDSSDAILLAGFVGGDLFGAYRGHADGFVAKIASDGTLIWAVQHGTNQLDEIGALAVDSADDVLVGGQSDGDLFAVNAGSHDAVFAKVGSNGAPVRQDQFGSTSHDAINAVAVDSTGRIVLAGSTAGDVAGPSQGDLDAFLIVLDP